jgi:hypothetical protein
MREILIPAICVLTLAKTGVVRRKGISANKRGTGVYVLEITNENMILNNNF